MTTGEDVYAEELARIGDQAGVGPSGGPSRRLRLAMLLLGLVFLAGLAGFAFVAMERSPVVDDPQAAGAGAEATAERAVPEADPSAAPNVAPLFGWSYRSARDEARGTVVRTATLRSENTAYLGFPAGTQAAELGIVRHGGVGTGGAAGAGAGAGTGAEITFGVANGEIFCDPAEGGEVRLRFDDGPVERVGCSGPPDARRNVVKLDSPESLLARIGGAGRLVVEAQFDSGGKQFVFSTEGLRADMLE